MGNVTLPTPVALAGGAICLLGGYLAGAVTGPDTPSRTTGVVTSYDAGTQEICLSGDAVDEQEGGDSTEGILCGRWQRTAGSTSRPRPGDEFRFVSTVVDASGAPEGEQDGLITLIYGDVTP